ncbi:MAG: class F sortase [Dehalococcoidia bacterium]|nr:class F sortase [Dehalococcoidia bacterium]
MRLRVLPLLVAAVGLCGLLGATLVLGADPPKLKYRAYAPVVTRGEFPPTPSPTAVPTPTPRPAPYDGPVASIYLGSARILGGAPVQVRDTNWVSGREVFQDPSAPQYIAHYRRFGHPGSPAVNTIFAAHVNYAGYGNGPFAYLLSAKPEDALYVTMANGEVYTYTVRSVELVHLDDLDMNPVVYPPLDSTTERVTLISCGGTFIPAAVGGEYTSRVILVAERYVG